MVKAVQVVIGILLAPLLLVLLLVYALIWVLPGFGYCYERHALSAHRRRYAPHGPSHSFHALSSTGGLRVHVVQTIIEPLTSTPSPNASPLPVVLFPGAAANIAATSFIIADVIRTLQSTDGGELSRPIHLIQFEHCGYGWSDPLTTEAEAAKVDFTGHGLCTAIHELLCVLLSPPQSTTHPPIIGYGQSYGGQLASLYCYTYPSSVSGLLLVDPSPPEVFDASQAPMASQLIAAPGIYRTTAAFAAVGFIRPLSSLMRYTSGEVREALKVMPEEYQGDVFTASHLRNMAREFTGFREASAELGEAMGKGGMGDVRVELVTAVRFSQLYGGKTEEETGAWWVGCARRYAQSSTRCTHDVQQRTHVQVCTDGALQGRLLKRLVNAVAKDHTEAAVEH